MSLAIKFIPTEEGPITSYTMAPDPRVANDEGVLCISSGPWDIMRLSWLQRQILTQLCEHGYQATRFDFCGTGESQEPTEAANCERWLRESIAMRDTLRKSVRKVHVIGFRLGAALALKASESYAFRSIHLIDPVLHGSTYWTQIMQLQQAFIASQNRYGVGVDAPSEVFGYPLGQSWQKAFEALDLRQYEGKGRRVYVYSSQAQPELEDFQSCLKDKSWDLKIIQVSDDFAWLNPLKLHMQCFARDTLRAIIQQFTEL